MFGVQQFDEGLYLLLDGSLPMLGSLDMGGFDITNVGAVDGVDVSTLAGAYTTHAADGTIHFTEASIDHTAIQNIGVNTHAQIDSHIASTSNPHSVTAAQVGALTAAQADLAYLRLDASNSPLTGKLILSDEGATANLSTGNYTLRLQSDKQNTGGPAFQFNTGFALTGTNYSHLFSSVGSFLLRMNTQGAEWSIPITVANATDAIKSGAYPVQMQASVPNAANNVAFRFNNTVTLSNDTAALLEVTDNGVPKFRYRPSTPGVSSPAGETGQLLLNDGGIFDDIEFTGLGLLGAVYFTNSAGARLGIFPNSGAFISSSSNIQFAIPNIASPTHAIVLDSVTSSFYPIGTPFGVSGTLGLNSANQPSLKWNNLFLNDNGPVSFGNNADATISWNTTDLVIDPDAQNVGGTNGLIRINRASSWPGAGATVTPALGNLPTAAAGTFAGWVAFKDNAGVTRYIPSFT